MRLIDRLRSRTPEVRADGDLASAYGLYSAFASAGESESIPATLNGYASQGFADNAIIFALVTARMNLYSQVEFKFQNLTDKSVYGNPNLSILETPWPGATTAELLARVELDVSCAGNFFAAKVDGRLVRLRPDWVTIAVVCQRDSMGREYDEVLGYVYQENGVGEQAFYAVDEVAHYSPIPDPLASYRGMSWITPVIRELNADRGMTAHKQATMDNAATPNLAIKYPGKLTPEIVQTLETRFAARHGGPANSGKTIILDAGADFTPITMNMKDLDFANIQQAGETRMAAAAQVPTILAGFQSGLDAATYSNYFAAQRKFADHWGRSAWIGTAAAFAKLVDVPSGSRLWFDVSSIAALREGEKEMAEATATKAGAALNFINAGYEPDSVTAALVSGDLSQLKHTQLIPTLLTPPGENPNAPTGSSV